ncbi:Chromo domain-containing protein [Gossypium australe]|uniref:Chromo domain-containing protein n=1 Tax=Gossypium australe TaxID=47621 RepID=A0A5B6VCB0_9ROSI|nr:Chromo domain-containing protein [Gossypium australe]
MYFESFSLEEGYKIWTKREVDPRFIGPYKVLELVGLVEYRLALPPELSKIHNMFHVSMLRRYQSNPDHVVQVETPKDVDSWYIPPFVFPVFFSKSLRNFKPKKLVKVRAIEGKCLFCKGVWCVVFGCVFNKPVLYARIVVFKLVECVRLVTISAIEPTSGATNGSSGGELTLRFFLNKHGVGLID